MMIVLRSKQIEETKSTFSRDEKLLEWKNVAARNRKRKGIHKSGRGYQFAFFMKSTLSPLNCQVGVRNLRGFSVPFGDESTELLFALNLPSGFGPEAYIQNVVVDPLSSMWTNGVVMGNPEIHNIIDLSSAQAKDVIQYFMFS